MNASWFHSSYVLFLLGVLLAVWMWRKYSFHRGLQTFSMTLFIALFCWCRWPSLRWRR